MMSTVINGAKIDGKGATKHCAFNTCKNDSRYGRGANVRFMPFPKFCIDVRKGYVNKDADHIKACSTCATCCRWIHRCKAPKRFYKISHEKKDSYICLDHFISDQGPSEECPDPLPSAEIEAIKPSKMTQPHCDVPTNKNFFLLNGNQHGDVYAAEQTNSKVQIDPLVDQHFTSNSLEHLFTDAESGRITSKRNQSLTQTSSSAVKFEILSWANAGDESSTSSYHTEQPAKSSTLVQKAFRSIELQTIYGLTEEMKLRKDNVALKKRKKVLKSLLEHEKRKRRQRGCNLNDFESRLKKNDEMAKFYTGFDYAQIVELHDFFTADWTSRQKTIRQKKTSHLQEILLTLVRLRSGFLTRDLGYRFVLSSGLVSKVFNSWIQLMFDKFSDPIPALPHRDVIKTTIPEYLRQYDNLRLILDCMEVNCEKASRAPTLFKVLIGYTPDGTIHFVSDMFLGSMSDRDIVEKSKLLDQLEEDDRILLARYLNISDLADERGINVEIPDFVKRKKKPTVDLEYGIIAKQKMFFKEVMDKIKQYKLLQQVMPLTMKAILEQVVSVCCFLSNFHKKNT